MLHRHVRNFLPLIILIIFIVVVYVTNLQQFFNLETLKKQQASLKVFVTDHPFVAPLLFIGVYTVSVILIIPDSTLLTLFAGLAFPIPLAILYSAIAESLGALLFFIILKAINPQDWLKERKLIHKMRKGFSENSASFLLSLRVSHIFPFWVISFWAAYCSTYWLTFLWTTFVGVLPLIYLLVSAGHDLGQALARQEHFSLGSIFTIQTRIAFLVMALIPLIPVVYKKWIK